MQDNYLPYWMIFDSAEGRDKESQMEAERIEAADREDRFYRELMENVRGSRYRDRLDEEGNNE